MTGTLFVVATPIGNLEDLSFRALRILKTVDLIAAEDTRRTAKLLAHYEIRKPMVSLREHNERRESPRLVARLAAGESVALVSDAGTPGISDPGAHLVSLARAAGIAVTAIPGPSAVMTALSASGVPAEQFVFMGFPPRSGRDRTDWIDTVAREYRTVVFFEAPHRIRRTIEEMVSTGISPIWIHRELSKFNEELIICHSTATVDIVSERGEFACVVPERPFNSLNENTLEATYEQAVRMFYCMTNNGSFSEYEALELVAKALSLKPSQVKKAVKKDKIARKRGSDPLS